MTWGKMRGFLTMVAENEEGQSIFEFMLMLPMLVGLSVILVRINSAIQSSIVNQKYARAQALFLTFNSAFYPRLEQQMSLINYGNNQMILGVSDNPAPVGEGEYLPKASTQLISRNKKMQASDAPKEEPNLRANVRVRNSVTLCTQTLFTASGQGGVMAILPLGGNPIQVVGRSTLNELTRFNNICGSSMKYE
jgi:hypothetical protein